MNLCVLNSILPPQTIVLSIQKKKKTIVLLQSLVQNVQALPNREPWKSVSRLEKHAQKPSNSLAHFTPSQSQQQHCRPQSEAGFHSEPSGRTPVIKTHEQQPHHPVATGLRGRRRRRRRSPAQRYEAAGVLGQHFASMAGVGGLDGVLAEERLLRRKRKPISKCGVGSQGVQLYSYGVPQLCAGSI